MLPLFPSHSNSGNLYRFYTEMKNHKAISTWSKRTSRKHIHVTPLSIQAGSEICKQARWDSSGDVLSEWCAAGEYNTLHHQEHTPLCSLFKDLQSALTHPPPVSNSGGTFSLNWFKYQSSIRSNKTCHHCWLPHICQIPRAYWQRGGHKTSGRKITAARHTQHQKEITQLQTLDIF